MAATGFSHLRVINRSTAQSSAHRPQRPSQRSPGIRTAGADRLRVFSLPSGILIPRGTHLQSNAIEGIVSQMAIAGKTLTISDIEHFHDALENSVAVDVHFLNDSLLSLAAASELACILSQSRSSALEKTIDSKLEKCGVWKLFRRMRISQVSRTNHENVTLMRVPKALDEQWVAAEAKRLETCLLQSRFPKNLSRSITGAVLEMIDNVWVHSSSNEDPLFCYQVAQSSFSFAVTDMGVGVLRTLRKNRRFSHLKTSMGALEQAVKIGVSSNPDGSGLGLPTLTRALADLWGKTRLRSGQAALTFNREQENHRQSQQFLPDMNGFQISAICRLQRPK